MYVFLLYAMARINSPTPLLWFVHWVLCVDHRNFFFIPLLRMDVRLSLELEQLLAWELPLLFDNGASRRTSSPLH